jgi:hypothetical protein
MSKISHKFLVISSSDIDFDILTDSNDEQVSSSNSLLSLNILIISLNDYLSQASSQVDIDMIINQRLLKIQFSFEKNTLILISIYTMLFQIFRVLF